ncbi:MAG: hypothetical protein C9356_05700 [Oleiphilus sp.]|nr:MAG: hypothetical protein C9356_05700 [Oleiphilus sp.]
MSAGQGASTLGAGSRMFAGVTVLSKGLTFITQVVLGWYLSAEEFGLYALALSLSVWGLALRNGGSDQYLIQRGDAFVDIAPTVLSFSFIFNVLAAIVLCLIGIVAAQVYAEPMLIWLMAVIGLAQILTSPGAVMRAYLAVHRRYTELALAGLCSDAVRQCSTMALAFLGAGVFSFVVPMALEPVMVMAVVYVFIRFMPRPGAIGWRPLLAIAKHTRWLMMGNLATALLLSGVYFVIGLVLQTNTLGVVFFALHLVVAASVPLTHTLQNIYFAHVANTRDSQVQTALLQRGLQASLSVALVLALLISMSAPWVVSTVWGGRWDAAIPLLQLAALGLPGMVLQALVAASLSARALWRIRLFYLLSAAVIEIAVAGIVVMLASLESLMIALVVVRIVWGCLGIVVLERTWQTPAIVRIIRLPMLTFVLIAALAMVSDAWQMAWMLAIQVAFILYLLGNWVLNDSRQRHAA